MSSIWHSIFELSGRVLYPTCCVVCGQLGRDWCNNCHDQVEYRLNPKVWRPAWDNLPQIVSAQAPCLFTGVIRELVHQLKYQHVQAAAKVAAQLIYHACDLPKNCVITGVPSHKNRVAERGYSQAEEIAKELAKLANLAYLPILKRTRPTNTQVSLGKNARMQLSNNTFEAVDTDTLGTMKNVLLIDDVLTTGSTLTAATLTFHQNRLLSLHLLVLATKS